MATSLNERDSPPVEWDGDRLDVPRIEAELSRLRHVADPAAADGRSAALRTNLSNMIVYTETEAAALLAGDAMDQLSSHHPSRAVIIVADAASSHPGIRTTLRAHCHIVPGLEQGVCCEEITLGVRGPVAGHLHSVIAPLLIPDLPVNVWWSEDLPEERHAFDEMLDIADRLIVDSEKFPAQAEGLLKLHSLVDPGSRQAIGDLAWGRVEMWRDLLLGQRQVAEIRHHLSSVTGVEVRYASGIDGGSSQAYFVLASIAAQLGWDASAVTCSGGRFVITHENREIDAYLQPVRYSAVPPGWIVSIKIACRSSTARALLSMSRTGDPRHVVIRTEHRGTATEDQVLIEDCRTGDVLVRQLEGTSAGAPYSRILRDAISLIRAERYRPGSSIAT
jgi:glucose-6-phosphate dehydrogenase assembly protein OpcA